LLQSLADLLPPTLDENNDDHGSRTTTLSSLSEWWPATVQMQLTSNLAATANYAIP
jgi:hypothetical protein